MEASLCLKGKDSSKNPLPSGGKGLPSRSWCWRAGGDLLPGYQRTGYPEVLFVCSDRNLLAAAEKEKLGVHDPEAQEDEALT
jgi:hypothetical protein